MTDARFANLFAKTVIALLVLTLCLITLGIVVGGPLDDKRRAQTAEYSHRIVAERTQPIGLLNVGKIEIEMQSPSQPEVQVALVTEENLGKSVYDKACNVCHGIGLTGAPKPGDVANWQPRIAKSVETLYSNAINGFQGKVGVMPPKGGNLTLSDDEVKAAVDYLVSLVQ